MANIEHCEINDTSEARADIASTLQSSPDCDIAMLQSPSRLAFNFDTLQTLLPLFEKQVNHPGLHPAQVAQAERQIEIILIHLEAAQFAPSDVSELRTRFERLRSNDTN